MPLDCLPHRGFEELGEDLQVGQFRELARCQIRGIFGHGKAEVVDQHCCYVSNACGHPAQERHSGQDVEPGDPLLMKR